MVSEYSNWAYDPLHRAMVELQGIISRVQTFIRSRTEESLASSTLLDDLNESGLQLFDGRNVVGKDTHITRFSWDVDLDTVYLVDSVSFYIAAGDFGTRS